MPWLEKGGTSTSNVAHAHAQNTQLLFVHIPRCGGTSLMKAHGLQEKILTGPDCPWYKQVFLNIFFSRYETFEKVNFPIWTQLNAGCLVLGVVGAIWLHLIDHGTTHYNAVALPTQVWYRMFAITLIAASTIIFVVFTYVLNAPTIARIRCIRRAFLLLNEYLLCQVMADREYITGVNIDGYLPHLTANKLLGLAHHITPSSPKTTTTTAGNHPYVPIKTWQTVATFAIVRNPYARMVSVYMYNRFGPWETFPHFVRSWYRSTSQAYRRDHQVHDWYVPNHALPQFEYTHSTTCLEDNDNDEDNNNGINTNTDDHGQPLYQLVQSIIKLEDLKYLNKNRNNKTTNRNTVKNPAIDASDGDSSSSLSSDENEDENDGSNDIILVDESQDDTSAQAQRKTPAYRHRHSKSSSTATSTSTGSSSSSGSGSGNGRSLQNLPEVVYEALANMPHDNSRKTDVPWYDLYDQETLALVYEMYARDFEVFQYDRELPHRPDLHRPTNIRQQRRGFEFSKPSAAACSTTTTSSTKKQDDESLLLSTSSSHKDNDDSSQDDVHGNDADSTDDCWYPGYYASKIFHLRQRRRCSDAGGSNVSLSLQQQQQKYTSVLNGDDNI